MEKFRATNHKYDSQGRFIITLSRNEKLGSALRQWIPATRSHWMRAWARSVRWPSLSRMPNYLHWSQTTSKQLFWADKHINFTTKSARCVRALYQVRTTFTSDVVRAVPMWEHYTLTHPDTHIHTHTRLCSNSFVTFSFRLVSRTQRVLILTHTNTLKLCCCCVRIYVRVCVCEILVNGECFGFSEIVRSD